ncbi:MAG: hypothetical protein AAFZ01_14940 [Pseudomonadota bacterium]
MPHPLAIAAIGAGLFASARWARRRLEALQADHAARELKERSSKARASGTLKADPDTGVYRPR